MITLKSDCLLFKLDSGEHVPMSPDMMIQETVGELVGNYDQEFLSHAANAVFHYFKHDLGLETISMGEFAGAFEKVLHGLRLDQSDAGAQKTPGDVFEFSLSDLALKPGSDSELFFFAALRKEVRELLSKAPKVIRFYGLRSCVKQLAGANKWSSRCRELEEGIVGFLRKCAVSESHPETLGLVIE